MGTNSELSQPGRALAKTGLSSLKPTASSGSAGDAAGAERSYRALLAAQPDPIIVSRFRLRATIGLIRALRAQKKDAEAETLRTELLDRLRWQSWPDGPQIVAVRRAMG